MAGDRCEGRGRGDEPSGYWDIPCRRGEEPSAVLGLWTMIDDTDLQIITILQENGRIPAAEVARRVGMAPSAVFERIRKLEERGVITSYSANLNPNLIGLSLLAFVFVNIDERVNSDESGRKLAAIPGVMEVHHVAGEDSYLVKVRAKDPEGLGRLLREHIGAISTVRNTRTTIVLETLKHTSSMPLVNGGSADGAGTKNSAVRGAVDAGAGAGV